MRKSKKNTELSHLIQSTLTGDENAFTELIRLYQNFAYATACSLLNDDSLAQDAVQESFLTVYYQLPKLKNAESFPTWLNTIVKRHCYRMYHTQKSAANVIQTSLRPIQSDKPADELLTEKERKQRILDALEQLPDSLREIVYLFYIREHTQEEVASYTGFSKSTVNNRLFSARKILKRRLFDMVKDTIKSKKMPDDFAHTVGKIVRVQGPIIDARTDSRGASSLFDCWTIADRVDKSNSRMTIIQREVDGKLRLINLGDEKKLKVGSKIRASKKEQPSPVSDELLKKAITAISPSKDGKTRLCETGIKIIDLMSPLPAKGTVGLFGLYGIGRSILVMELYHRLINTNNKLNVVYFVSQEEAINLRTMIDREPNFPPDKDETLETFWLVTSKATDPDYTSTNKIIDSSLFFSPLLSCRDLYPSIDCVNSTSKLLRGNIVNKEHKETACRVGELLKKSRRLSFDRPFLEYVAMGAYKKARQWYHDTAKKNNRAQSPEEQTIAARVRKLELFFTQPFFTTESFTKVAGMKVSLKDTIDGCRAIVDGAVDDIPENAFAFSGTIDDIKKKAKK